MYVFRRLLAVSCNSHILREHQEVKKYRRELAGDRVCSSKAKIGERGMRQQRRELTRWHSARLTTVL